MFIRNNFSTVFIYFIYIIYFTYIHISIFSAQKFTSGSNQFLFYFVIREFFNVKSVCLFEEKYVSKSLCIMQNE